MRREAWHPRQRRLPWPDLDAADPRDLPPEEVTKFGKDVPMGRPGQPKEVAACFVFLASEDASYMAGQVLHPNGAEVVNG